MPSKSVQTFAGRESFGGIEAQSCGGVWVPQLWLRSGPERRAVNKRWILVILVDLGRFHPFGVPGWQLHDPQSHRGQACEFQVRVAGIGWN